jgi:poly(3-hydroxybutyrate) depolymerase
VQKFLVLYRSPVPARERMANATPEQAQAGMEGWQAWAEKAGSSIADFRRATRRRRRHHRLLDPRGRTLAQAVVLCAHGSAKQP